MTVTDDRLDAISRNHDHDGGHSLLYGRMVKVAEQAQRKAARKAARHRKRRQWVSASATRGPLSRTAVKRNVRQQLRQWRRRRRMAKVLTSPARLGAWGAKRVVSFALRPVRIVLTIIIWLLLLLLLLPVIFPGLRDAPLLGGIIPGAMPASGDCGVPVRPVGGYKGAAAAMGQTVNAMREGTDPARLHEGILAGARELGASVAIFRATADGAPVPTEPVPQHGVPGYDNRLQVTAPAAVAASSGTGSVDEAAAAIVAAGATGEDAATFVAIAGAESRYVREAANPTSSARGYWQIMVSVHDVTEAQAFDPLFAARFAVKLKDESPRGFAGPWAETYGVGSHEPYMADARAAVARAEAAATSTTAVPAATAVGGAACLPGQSGDGVVRQAGLAGDLSAQGYTNGELPPGVLVPLSWTSGQLRQDAATSLEALNVAYRQAFGANLSVTDTYRDRAGQEACTRAKGSMCAVPGTSQHGWGVAADLGGGVQSFGTPQHEWMVRNAPTFGWVLPEWAQQGGSKPEPWHWEYAQAVSAG